MLALVPVVPAPTTPAAGGSTMGTILGLFTGGLPFGGAIVAALLIAGGIFWGVEASKISSRDTQIAELHCQIDGPTTTPPCSQNGFRAQLQRATGNLAVANANIDDLTKSVVSQKSQIDKLASDTQTAVTRTQSLQAQLVAANTKAANVARLLEANKPVAPSYAALTGLIKQVVP